MRSNDKMFLNELESAIRKTNSPQSFNDLIGFPYDSVNVIKALKNQKSITLELNRPNFNSIISYGRRSDLFMHYLSLSLSLSIMILFSVVIYSIYTKEYFYLFGVFTWLFGFGTSSSKSRLKWLVGPVTLFFLLSIFFFPFIYCFFSGVFVLSYLFTKTNRDITIDSVINNALESEQLFTYLFAFEKILVIFDNEQKHFLYPDDYGA